MQSPSSVSFDNQLSEPLEQCFNLVQGGWRKYTDAFYASDIGQKLVSEIDKQVLSGELIYPATPFLALTLTPLEKVRVVILGQDPYHGAGQAQGLAFSVAQGVRIPPSLRNIFKELQRDLGTPIPQNGSLVHWAQQGVLLLNATFTVKDSRPASHAKKGWEVLSDVLIQAVAKNAHPVVFMLWGAYAQAKAPLIQSAAQQSGVEHLILQANHPSPLSASRPPVPFIGCGHFSAANHFLKQQDDAEIVW